MIEIDEIQHFTSFRLTTLRMYPEDAPLGFERAHYEGLCAVHAAAADRYRATKAAPTFGVGGRQRQRAYYDALRDLAAPAMGRPPVIRVDAVMRDGAQAYRVHRDRIRTLLCL